MQGFDIALSLPKDRLGASRPEYRLCYDASIMPRRRLDGSYFKSAVFGFEDGLVSTTGIVAGIAAGSKNPKFVLLAGLVAIGVEAVSMGAGEFLSERSLHQIRGNHHRDKASLSGVLMSFSFVVAGLIPITPVAILPFPQSVYVSLAAALVALFFLGIIKARLIHVPLLRSAVETIVIGGGATLIGFIVGLVLKV